MFGEWGCVPLIAFGKAQTSAAFKLLARAKDLDFEIANKISKQLRSYELDRKHELENAVDDDFDVDDIIQLRDYIDPEYLDIVEDSKKYRGIILSVSPHPCAHITYHKDLREEVGVVRVKSQTGGKVMYCLFMDGATADRLNYVKSDLLRVDVVKLISDSFKAAGLSVMPVEELLKLVQNDTEVWNLYWKGFTQGLNQVEKQATTDRCKAFKPKNVVELTCLIAAIRPGFKSMLQKFIYRTPFTYGIKSLDELLRIDGMTGVSASCSYLLFDEQILRILIAGGIDGAKAYQIIKFIKKKKQDKVVAAKEEFRTGFTSYLKEKEGASEELASKVVDQIWKIIEDSSSYLFCASHAFAMACDSLYAAYLKAHYPYEFYMTMLKHYTSKRNLEKIAAIIAEMGEYRHIHMTAPAFGQDNTDWFINKEENTVSPSLSYVKFISDSAAKELAGAPHCETFCDVLFWAVRESSVNMRQIQTLIDIGYFRNYGGQNKLNSIMDEFLNGKSRITRTTKGWSVRLDALKKLEAETEDSDVPAYNKAQRENDLMGLCFSSDPTIKFTYLVTDVDDKYGVKIRFYNVGTGKYSPFIRMKKDFYELTQPKVGELFNLNPLVDCRYQSRRIYSGGKSVPVPGEKETWIFHYERMKEAA